MITDLIINYFFACVPLTFFDLPSIQIGKQNSVPIRNGDELSILVANSLTTSYTQAAQGEATIRIGPHEEISWIFVSLESSNNSVQRIDPILPSVNAKESETTNEIELLSPPD